MGSACASSLLKSSARCRGRARHDLVIAFAVSAALHAAALMAVHLRPPPRPAAPIPLTVVLLGTGRDSAQSAPQASTPNAVAAAPAPTAVPSAAPSSSSRAEPAREGDAKAPVAAPVQPRSQELTSAPVPAQEPALAPEVQQQLRGRRLQVEVWVDATGAVRKSELRTGEIDADLARQLGEAIARARFVPGRHSGKPVEDVVRLRLCFDEEGRPDASDENCWAAAVRSR